MTTKFRRSNATCFVGRYRQGIHVDLEGVIVVKGREFKKGIVLWEDTAPRETALRVKLKKKQGQEKMWLYNVGDDEQGNTWKWAFGAAMRIEKMSDGARKYHCNDGKLDDDLDDLIFKIEKVED